MKKFDWDITKNSELIKKRNISFEENVSFIEQGNILDIVINSKAKYQHQKMFIVGIKGYAYIVPFVERDKVCFLKTIFPSRKATKQYFMKEVNDEAR